MTQFATPPLALPDVFPAQFISHSQPNAPRRHHRASTPSPQKKRGVVQYVGMLIVGGILLGAVRNGPVIAQTALTMRQLSGNIVGEVATVDVSRSALRLIRPQAAGPATMVAVAEPTTFVVDTKATITKDYQPVTLGHLRAGDVVEVNYVAKDDTYIARAIVVKPSSASSVH